MAAADFAITVLYIGIVVAETVLAFLTLHPQLSTWALVLDVWSAAAAGWLLGASGVRKLVWLRLPEGLPRLAWIWVSLGVLGCVVVAFRSGTALIEPSKHASYGLLAILFGAVGALARKRIVSLGSDFALWVLSQYSRKARPQDRLVTGLVLAAGESSKALVGRGAESWRNPAQIQNVAATVQNAAWLVESAPMLIRGAKWWEFGLRTNLAAPYRTVASIVRGHRIKVLAAQSEAEWSTVCASLSAGALSAVRLDWTELTHAATSSKASRLPVLRRVLRRVAAPATLVASAILLPIVFPLGSYAASLRSILAVSAVLALLPNQSEAAGVIRDTMAKTQSWHK